MRILRIVFALLLAGAILAAAWFAFERAEQGREVAVAILAGAAFGLVLQRGRFCFFCILREAFEERETRPLLGVIAALATGTIGTVIVFSAWLPDASAGYLPPAGNIGPVSWPLYLGGLAFGLGMAFSGSCISAHLYRLSEGSWLSPVALAGIVVGFGLGFHAWNPLYLASYSTAPVVWLPAKLGFAGATLLQLLVLGLLAWGLWRFVQKRPAGPDPVASSWVEALWKLRWPVLVTGLFVAAIAVTMLLRVEPIGVTSALGSLVRQFFDSLGWLPDRLEGLDGFRGCSTSGEGPALSLNAWFVLSLVTGAFLASFAGGHFEPERISWKRFPSALVGGVLLGFGAMISIGCTIGKLYSGITALSLCGWAFAVAMTAGVWLGLKLRRAWW